MRITLKNFRCYINETFDFGEGGIVLLSGPSGQGKSSILCGIYFALYGSGSKVTSCGKTSCSVELEFDGMKIIRTKRPNRVVVDSVYEDDVAQELINKKFGDAFDVTGYVAQNAINSFILMSPIDKLSFLEKFAFKDVDVVNIKGRCKSHISKCHDELLSIVSQLDMANTFFSEMTKPTEVKFPLKCKDNVETREKAEKNEQIRINNCNVQIRRTEKTKEFIFKAKYPNLKFFYGDGFEGLPTYAPFDKVIITAAAPISPPRLVEQLKVGGIMVIPVDEGEQQRMLRITKNEDGSTSEEAFEQFSFVPMLTGRNG